MGNVVNTNVRTEASFCFGVYNCTILLKIDFIPRKNAVRESMLQATCSELQDEELPDVSFKVFWRQTDFSFLGCSLLSAWKESSHSHSSIREECAVVFWAVVNQRTAAVRRVKDRRLLHVVFQNKMHTDL